MVLKVWLKHQSVNSSLGHPLVVPKIAIKSSDEGNNIDDYNCYKCNCGYKGFYHEYEYIGNNNCLITAMAVIATAARTLIARIHYIIHAIYNEKANQLPTPFAPHHPKLMPYIPQPTVFHNHIIYCKLYH